MKKEAKLLRCTVLSGSAWSTEKKYTRKYERKYDIFFWDKALNEERRNGGAVQQRGKGRMEICG